MVSGERFNSISHLVGAVLALAAATALVVNAARGGDAYASPPSSSSPRVRAPV